MQRPTEARCIIQVPICVKVSEMLSSLRRDAQKPVTPIQTVIVSLVTSSLHQICKILTHIFTITLFKLQMTLKLIYTNEPTKGDKLNKPLRYENTLNYHYHG